MRTFKTRTFSRFASRAQIDDAALCRDVDRVRRGFVDANLGDGVFKQRIARKCGGRAGGFRTIILFRRVASVFFVYGFEKSDRDSLRLDELETFRRLADKYLELDRAGLETALAGGVIIEVNCDGQTI